MIHLSGATASGKSAVAVELATRLNGEILSADSMQVYRGLDLGTAKPTAAERARVPHHLLDLAEPGDGFDTARWLEAARQAREAVVARGRIPILCGGTGLYFRAWFTGLEALPPSDPALRSTLEALPLEVLLSELADRAPDVLGTLDTRNPRRVVRAVEILRLGGSRRPRPPHRWPAADSGAAAPASGESVIVLRRTPDDLRRRMEARVDAMFAAGLVEETRQLLARGLANNRTALQAIGYRQVVDFLRGVRDLEATMKLVKARTWQFGRRQMAWFRHQLPVIWLDVAPGEDPRTTAGKVLKILEAGGEGNRS